MRRLVYLAFVMLLAVLASSCQRRGFSEHTSPVNLKIKIVTDMQFPESATIPDMVRVDLFNPQTGRVEYTDYLPATGGYIYPRPGTYNMLVYNIGTESTIVRNENDLEMVEAYTNEVSAYLKNQLKSFLETRFQMREEKAAAAGSSDEGTDSKGIPTKDPILEGNERIVNEPDYLWVSRMDNVDIPALALDEDRDITLYVEAGPVVETWEMIVKPVEGLQWVSNVKALITGQVESTYIGKVEDSKEVVTIYFEMEKDVEGKRLVGKFNTFGKNPLYLSFLSLDINIIDNLGNEHHYHFDVTEDFFDNPEFVIDVENPIVIEEPKIEGGGFSPSVSDWEDVITNIEL